MSGHFFEFLWKRRKNQKAQFSVLSDTSPFDLLMLTVLLAAGGFYLHDSLYWGIAWVGNSQYGDAEFWWNGAIHISQGLFHDNPGNGFRPGYFFLTGLLLPIFGQQFQHFYPFFLAAFLTISGLFYLALSQLLGKFISACVVAMLIFNPYTAEWLATSTTDGTGLLLNILALTCLLFGVQREWKPSWLMAFAFLFSLATLTRPLVTPFIGITLVLIFFLSKDTIKKRMQLIMCILMAFCIPTLLWMGIQKLTIDRWSISSNDASAFYAASEPNVQVWNGSMYDKIQQIAAKHYKVPVNKVTDQMINQIFWQETIKNYFRYPNYHIKRILPHFLQIAKFNPSQATHGTLRWRKFFFAAILLCLAWGQLVQERRTFALAFVILGVSICLLPKIITYMVLAGAVLSFIKRDKTGPGMVFLSSYWITGVISLYLVGGTWGLPSFSAQFDLNALGYRLGSQVFFVGDILAAYFLVCLAQIKCQTKYALTTPSSLARNLVISTGRLFLYTTLSLYLIGGSIVAYRFYMQNHGKIIELFPSTLSIMNSYHQKTGKNLVLTNAHNGGIDSDVFSQTATKKSDVIFTGTVSPFVWSLPGQKRTQIMVYAQNNIKPPSMGPGRVFIDVPQRLRPSEWIGKQGAFIIHDVPDKHNISNLPYYITAPTLRAFVPFIANEHQFAFSKTRWFPFIKNATQLDTSGELKIYNADIDWTINSGEQKFKRRFFIAPHQLLLHDDKIQLHLDTSTAKGTTLLSFSYAIDKKKQIVARQNYYDVTVSAIKNSKEKFETLLFSTRDRIPIDSDKEILKKISVSIPQNTKALNIIFDHLSAGTGVWIYEFNLSATDFISTPTAKTDQLGYHHDK